MSKKALLRSPQGVSSAERLRCPQGVSKCVCSAERRLRRTMIQETPVLRTKKSDECIVCRNVLNLQHADLGSVIDVLNLKILWKTVR